MVTVNSSGCRPRPLPAVRLRFLVCALAVAWTVPAQVRIQGRTAAEAGDSPPHWSVSGSQGRSEPGFEPIRREAAGLAVLDGDMVLAAPETAPNGPTNRRPAMSAKDGSIPRRDIAPVASDARWPQGTVPYVIEPGFTEDARRDIQEAIHHWNSRTVVTFVPRSAELDYLRFRPEPLSPTRRACAADLGRRGGAQSIWLVDSEGCGVGPTIHEMGHTIGLGHEHQRPDRDAYVIVAAEGDEARSDLAGDGPYDYASIMHYGGIQTIPPGMLAGGRQLSAGDIDGVARMYGKPPTLTTVSTNPAGLDIVVDGQRVATPVQLDWSSGRAHQLEAPLLQSAGGTRYLFGRWNDRGERRRRVTAHPEATWLEANYIVQRSVVACADPPDAGSVTIHPESRDGFHTIETPLRLTVQPAAGSSREFTEWLLVSGGPVEGSPASNPILAAFGPEPGPGPVWTALFSESPVYRIDANIEGVAVRLNGAAWPTFLPAALPASQFRSLTVDLWESEADASLPVDVRHRFLNWSDGGPRSRTIAVPESGGAITLNVAPEYRLLVRGGAEEAGSILTSPRAEDGFYADGTQVSVTAQPAPGWHFAGWMGAVSGKAPTATVVMDGPKFLEAAFTLSEPLQTGTRQEIALPATPWPEVHSRETGYNVFVPPDAVELTVEFRSPAAAEVDLYVALGYEVGLHASAVGGEPTIASDYESKSRGANETIVIDRQSSRPLTSGIYFIGFETQPSSQDIRGTLAASVKRVGVSRVAPRAFTFVSPVGSDPPPQAVRVFPAGSGTARFRVESDRTWLAATPREWMQTGPGARQLSITVNNATLPPGTHEGKLRVVNAEFEPPSGGAPVGVEIPVTFVNVGQLSAVPAASAVEIASEPREGQTYRAGERIEVEIQLTHPVKVVGSPELALAIGNRTSQASWNPARSARSCGDSYASLAFTYLVTAADTDLDGIGVPTDALTLGDATIRGLAGTEMHLALGHQAIAGAAEHRVNGRQALRPQVDGVRFTSYPQDGDSYGAGEAIELTVTFDIQVEVSGPPQLALLIGNRRVQAALSGSDGNSAWFRYVVQTRDRDFDGLSVPADGLALNGGAIRSLTGADARLSLGAHAIANRAGQRADGSRGTVPTVRGLWLYGQPRRDGRYGAGEGIEVGLEFSLPVEVRGQPQLALLIGDRRVQAALVGSERNWVSFRYVVQAGDRDADGVSVPADGLTLNDGSIRSLAGAAARLDLGSHAIANSNGHRVDGRQ